MDGQDWNSVSWDTRGVRKSGESKKQALQKAARTGTLVTDKKHGAGTNAQVPTATHAARVEEDAESFEVAKVSLELKKLLQQERTKAGLTQKELATACNMKATIIQDYEAGKAIPNGMMLGKIERAIKQKNPGFVSGTFTKAQKKAVEKSKAKKAALAGVKKAGPARGPRATAAAGNQAPKARRF